MSVETRIAKNGKRTYSVRYRSGGRNLRKTFDRKADAQAFDAKARLARRSGDLAKLDAGRETLAEFTQEWWTTYAGANLELSTLKRYEQVWNIHIADRLGGYKLRELTPSVIATFRRDLEASGAGAPTVRKAMTMLQGILARAVEWERIPSNPVKSVKKPSAPRKRAVRALSPAQVEAIREQLLLPRWGKIPKGRKVQVRREPRYADAALVSVLAYAGLRPGEALALRWSSIGRNTLLVDGAVSLGEEKGDKTDVGPSTVRLLRPLASDLKELRVSLGRLVEEDELIFPGPDGGYWSDQRYRRWRRRVFKAHVKTAAGVPDDVRPYDLRHSFASLLIHEGKLTIIEIAEQMRHSSQMTLNVYGHVIRELAGEEVDAEEAIRKAREGVTTTEEAANG